jgi:deoxyribodipyrimidine photo-lyase
VKEEINIVWLKRDFRLSAHDAFYHAIESHLPFAIVCFFEPSIINDKHHSARHWQYIFHSVLEMNEKLSQKQLSPVLCYYGEVKDFFEDLGKNYVVKTVFSHLEIGVQTTFNRDLEIKKFFKENKILWKEFKQNAVKRGLRNRKNWLPFYHEFINQPILNPEWEKAKNIYLPAFDNLKKSDFYKNILDTKYCFQKAGEDAAQEYLDSFFEKRHKNYLQNISRPFESVNTCSRLSAHIAWGNISVKQIFQVYKKAYLENQINKKQINAFMERVRWRCHFIQKFESEIIIEKQCFNQAFSNLKRNRDKTVFDAWSNGKTGFPLVDACMIALKETGYLNFRMRAMVASFYINILWQDWKWAAMYLSSVFLDFEPGIHYPQIHMQAGNTGIHTLRIYNPYKQSYEKDTEAKFILKWLPQLSKLPIELIHEPHKLTAMEEMMYDFRLGINYPKPIVDFENQLKFAKKEIAIILHSKQCQQEANRIKNQHVN